MASTGTVIILVAGGITFSNEWYQTNQINWRVPIATALLAAGVEGLSKLDPKAGTGLAVMILIAASLTEFNGKSAASTLTGLFPTTGKTGGAAPAGTASIAQPSTVPAPGGRQYIEG